MVKITQTGAGRMARPLGPLAQAGRWEPHKRRTLTTHRNPGLEVVWVERGHAEWQVEGRVARVPPGSVFFTLPWEAHGGVVPRQPGLELYYAVIRLDRMYEKPAASFGFHLDLRFSTREARGISTVLSQAQARARPAHAELARLGPWLVGEFGSDAPLHGCLLASLARLTVLELYRACLRPIEAEARETQAEARVRSFLRELPERCGKEWTLERMAAECRLGRSQFSQLVKQFTGDPPIMALNRIRVGVAQKRLADRHVSITEIALALGFGSSQYFAKIFREYTGLSAREYRRTQV
jgi:AraC-like DNA-binding protein